MRGNPNEADADQLDMEATNILMACGFQDITGQRISKVVSTLRYLEERVDAMIRIWGVDGIMPDEIPQARKDTRPDAHLLHGPSLKGGVDQSAVDELMNAPAPAPAVASGSSAAAEEIDWGLAVTESAAKAPEPEPPPPPPKPAKAEKKAKEPVKAPEPVLAESAALDQSSIDSLFP